MQQIGAKPMIAERAAFAADPAPTIWAYRLQRLWLTPFFRRLLRYGLPLACMGFFALAFFAREENVSYFNGLVEDAQESVRNRPQHLVHGVSIQGASGALESEISDDIATLLPISALELDLDDLRIALEDLPAVENAVLRLNTGGILAVEVREIQPQFIWRTSNGLTLLSEQGQALRQVGERGAFLDLPLVAGLGADTALVEARQILEVAYPLADRLRGLVRIGERRWDLVMTNGQTIMLPEQDPVAAMQQVVVLVKAQDVLKRDVGVVDMRNPRRPTLRIHESALASLRAARLSTTVEFLE